MAIVTVVFVTPMILGHIKSPYGKEDVFVLGLYDSTRRNPDSSPFHRIKIVKVLPEDPQKAWPFAVLSPSPASDRQNCKIGTIR